ncbi:hypothetical protein V8F33_011879 [Rhypophila sp. PSN 637]
MENDLADIKKRLLCKRRWHASRVRKTHFKYGYHLDKCLYNDVVDMFSDHPDAYVKFLGTHATAEKKESSVSTKAGSSKTSPPAATDPSTASSSTTS